MSILEIFNHMQKVASLDQSQRGHLNHAWGSACNNAAIKVGYNKITDGKGIFTDEYMEHAVATMGDICNDYQCYGFDELPNHREALQVIPEGAANFPIPITEEEKRGVERLKELLERSKLANDKAERLLDKQFNSHTQYCHDAEEGNGHDDEESYYRWVQKTLKELRMWQEMVNYMQPEIDQLLTKYEKFI